MSYALRRTLLVAFGCLTSLMGALACSAENADGDGARGGSGSNPIDLGNGASTNGGRSGTVGGAGNGPSCGGDDPFIGCSGISFETESIPLDIYILFDQSGSMLNDVGGITRMAAVQDAVSRFLRDDASRTLGVGIGYFGYQPIGQAVCDAGEYKPAVTVTRDHEAVISSLATRMPTGETPTSAALDGACRYATTYKSQNRGRNVVILLVTDGKPEAPVSCNGGGCCPTLEQATASARQCFSGATPIPTYVLGVGPNLDNLRAIAEAGGTKQAYLVTDQNVSANVLAALNNIRRDAQVPCHIELPPAPNGQTLDFDQVNVTYSRESCSAPIYRVSSADKCTADGGWHYDNPNSPNNIELCKASCDLVNNASVGLKVLVGCASVAPPVR